MGMDELRLRIRASNCEVLRAGSFAAQLRAAGFQFKLLKKANPPNSTRDKTKIGAETSTTRA